MDRSLKCTDCDELLSNESDVCPKCGSNKKTVCMGFSEDLRGRFHDQLRGIVKKEGTKKPVKEFELGDEKRISNNSWVDKTRIIDRENNEYVEVVKDKETGEIIHECKEALSDHFNHGSAKYKKEVN